MLVAIPFKVANLGNILVNTLLAPVFIPEMTDFTPVLPSLANILGVLKIFSKIFINPPNAPLAAAAAPPIIDELPEAAAVPPNLPTAPKTALPILDFPKNDVILPFPLICLAIDPPLFIADCIPLPSLVLLKPVLSMNAEIFPDQPSLEPSLAPSEIASCILSVVSSSSLNPFFFQPVIVETNVESKPKRILFSLALSFSSLALSLASRCSLAELPSILSSSPRALFIFLEALSLRFLALSNLRFSLSRFSSRIDSNCFFSESDIESPYLDISFSKFLFIDEIFELIELIDADAASLSISDLIKPLRARFCLPLRHLTDLLASRINSICLEAL